MQLEFKLLAIVPYVENVSMYTVYLFNQENKILLPFQTSKWSSESILLAKQRVQLPRPHIHNTLIRLIYALDAKPKEVLVYKYLDNAFYAYLKLQTKDNLTLEIDIKISDAVALALRSAIPIYVKDDVCTKAGIKVTKDLLDRSLEL